MFRPRAPLPQGRGDRQAQYPFPVAAVGQARAGKPLRRLDGNLAVMEEEERRLPSPPEA